jgi:tetratricopeptide (TPR) repeat protein
VPRALALSLALSLSLALTASARAQEPTADQLIEHGVALREDGRDAEALEMFERANTVEPSAQALAQIALAEHALGRLVDAEAHLVGALESTTDRFVRRNRELLEQALAEIRTQLTDLTLTGGVPGADVVVDGAPRGTMPLASTIRVQAGTTHVDVHADGYEPFSRQVIVAQGSPVTLEVTLVPISVAPVVMPEPESEPEPEPPPPPPPPVESSFAWRMPTGIALAAAGAIGLGVASGLMAWREDNARARLTCVDTDPACRARYGTAVDAETAGIATYVVSGLVAAAGVGLILWDILTAPSAERAFACAPGALSLACVARF